MKAIGMPPSDPRVSQMNDAQWLWCYMNIQEDQKEEELTWKARMDYLSWFINPQLAKSVFERDQREAKRDSRPIGSTEFRPDEAVYQSTEFELETKAAKLGYDPSSGVTPAEFLEQHKTNKETKKEVDIMNDDFDALLASGEFIEVPDMQNGAGDPTETFDDFIFRASHFKDLADQEYVVDGAEELIEDEAQDNSKEEDQKALKKYLEENGLTEDDIDIIELDDEE